MSRRPTALPRARAKPCGARREARRAWTEGRRRIAALKRRPRRRRRVPRLVVVGGNAAGMSAASKAKRRRDDLEVLVLEQGDHISYSSCGIPFLIEGTVQDPDALSVLDPQKAGERGIDVRLHTRAVAFNPYTKAIAVEGPDGRDEIGYDKLVLAMGTRPRTALPGSDLEGVFAIRHLGDGLRLLSHLQGHRTRKAIVVGGGPTGLEMAEALHRHGAKVEVYTRNDRILSEFDPEMTDGFPEWLEERGVPVHLGAEVQAFQGEGKLHDVLVDGKAHRADVAINATGIEPATEFAVKAGVAATRDGFLLVDDNLHTNYHDVWAAGDCVAPRHILTGRPTPVALALPANRMGRIAGDAVASSLEKIPVPRSSFPGVLGTAIARIFGLGFAKTGLTEQECKAERMDVETVVVEAKSKAGYMPDVGDLAVKMVADADSHKVLGCQLIGPEEAVLRVNAAAVAVQAGLKVQKLADTETAYSPPFSPVWDPVVLAAGELAKKLRR